MSTWNTNIVNQAKVNDIYFDENLASCETYKKFGDYDSQLITARFMQDMRSLAEDDRSLCEIIDSFVFSGPNFSDHNAFYRTMIYWSDASQEALLDIEPLYAEYERFFYMVSLANKWFRNTDCEGNKMWFVNVYLVDRVYGGPEEGGWWYDTGECIKTVITTFDKHEEVVQNLRFEYPYTGKRSSVLGGEDYDIMLETSVGTFFPKEIPYYE